MPIKKRRLSALLLKTGQTTSYGSGTGVDDGALQKGVAKSYTIIAKAGNTNVTINSKTFAHPNNCVQDNNTGLMWSQTKVGGVGPASDGLLPWTTTGSGATAEGIFPYVVAANAAGLAGYSDWRIPNAFEAISLYGFEATGAVPDSTAFPGYSGTLIWTSTTRPNSTVGAYQVGGLSGQIVPSGKTNTCGLLLVRGGG
jgi:hypothetical protein